MAADLATTPSTGLSVQLGGDAHLSNFGAYASPERALIADANDFDETLPGPWEWDLKRLVASFHIAARDQGFSRGIADAVTRRTAASYSDAMRGFAEMGFLELWYTRSTVAGLPGLSGITEKRFLQTMIAFDEKARTKNNLQAFKKLAERVDGTFQLRSIRPVLVPIREVLPAYHPDEIEEGVRTAFDSYLTTLRPDRQMVLKRYDLLDIALKVVGVGSVGTRCFVMLLRGRDEKDPLFLQAKEANASVLEEFVGPSEYPHHGERVVQGQRMIQAQSDIFLGWSTGLLGIQYYMRQLRDWKGTANIAGMNPAQLSYYGAMCGYLLARGHARTGDPAAISGYIGTSATFVQALVRFGAKYADQNERDYAEFKDAISSGRLAAADRGAMMATDSEELERLRAELRAGPGRTGGSAPGTPPAGQEGRLDRPGGPCRAGDDAVPHVHLDLPHLEQHGPVRGPRRIRHRGSAGRSGDRRPRLGAARTGP